MMKLSASIGIGVLSLLLGIPSLMYAQDEPKQQEEPKAEKDQPKEEAKPSKEMKPPKQQDEKQQQQEEKQQESNRPAQQEQERNSNQKQDQKFNNQQASNSGKNGGRIPDDKFRSHFGRSHTVVINQPVIVEGQPRFQSGGYWFVISQPWPAGWAYTDQCYIDFVDGEYVLYDLSHPGVTIVLTVVM